MVLSFLVGTLCCWLQAEHEFSSEKKCALIACIHFLRRIYLYFSVFNSKYREHYPIFQKMKQEAIPGKAEWTEWEANEVNGKSLKNRTSVRSGLTYHWLRDKAEILVDFPDKIFSNASLPARGSFWMYRMEMNKEPGSSCLQSTFEPQVGGSCGHVLYSFIYLDGDLITSLDTSSFRSHERILFFWHVDGRHPMQENTGLVHLSN